MLFFLRGKAQGRGRTPAPNDARGQRDVVAFQRHDDGAPEDAARGAGREVADERGEIVRGQGGRVDLAEGSRGERGVRVRLGRQPEVDGGAAVGAAKVGPACRPWRPCRKIRPG